MASIFPRPLVNKIQIETFLKNVLEMDLDEPITSEIVNKIKYEEDYLQRDNLDSNTLKDLSTRDIEYREEKKRWKIRESIIYELYNQERLENDDEITLGNGGAKPKDVYSEKKAYILIGPPASGKSSIASKIANQIGAYIIDSDYAKRKIPEFKELHGAAIVHDESDYLTFNYSDKTKPAEFRTLYELCNNNGDNIVIPKIGNNLESLLLLNDKLKKDGYTTNLVLVSLDRQKATIRALHRFLKSKRYVPLALIFDGFANDSFVSFYRACMYHKSEFELFIEVTTDTKTHPYEVKHISDPSLFNPL